jgi:DNA-directed RNA polymerase sigma subunit (sigma70/sigma32)
LDVKEERSGALQLNHPQLEVDQLQESCALDVADRGGETLETVGRLIGTTMERARQIIEQATTGISFVSVSRLRRTPAAAPVEPK